MSKFDVTVTDKSGGAVNGAWFVVKGPKGSVVNGKFSVDTSTFSDGSKLGVYTLVVISSDGKHAGTATFEIVCSIYHYSHRSRYAWIQEYCRGYHDIYIFQCQPNRSCCEDLLYPR